MPNILTRIKSAYAEYLKSPCDTCKPDEDDEMCFSCQRKQKHKAEATKALIELMPELMDAEGKTVIELPCKVGDTVYAVSERKILKCRVTEICIASYGISYVQLFSKDDRLANFKYDYFCKTVFLTESAAREAMEGTKSHA